MAIFELQREHRFIFHLWWSCNQPTDWLTDTQTFEQSCPNCNSSPSNLFNLTTFCEWRIWFTLFKSFYIFAPKSYWSSKCHVMRCKLWHKRPTTTGECELGCGWNGSSRLAHNLQTDQNFFFNANGMFWSRLMLSLFVWGISNRLVSSLMATSAFAL